MSRPGRPRSAPAPFFCTSCGNESLRWEGRCPSCGDWNTLAEAPGHGRSRAGSRPLRPQRGEPASAPLRDAAASEAKRLGLGVGDLDLVLGGGLVAGSLVLLGGPPGIGKSTLLLQAAASIRRDDRVVLYVSGEESAPQVRLRAERIGGGALEIAFFGATDVEEVIREAEASRPLVLGIDSIHTLTSPRSEGPPGSVGQVRECASALQEYAKATRTPVIMVGHVTKQGQLAGPRTLEHLVDAVLHLEGSRGQDHRLLRATKNRFGSVDEVAVFRMGPSGLTAVDNPSEVFLSGTRSTTGSAIAVIYQGSRPLLAEVQSLTSKSRFGTPQRTTSGFPTKRLALLLTVLERRAGVPAIDRDVFVNVVGGLRLTDPAADLSVAAALASAELDRPTGSKAFVGELGLGGEVRPVPRLESRVAEAGRLGIGAVVAPAAPDTGDPSPRPASSSLPEVISVSHVREIVEMLE